MIMLDNTVVNVALPSIQRDLGADLSELEWIVTGYALTFASLMLVGGKVADAYGRRLVFVVGIVVFTLASLSCGLAGSSEMLIGSRIHRRDVSTPRARDGHRDLGGNLGAGAGDRAARRRPDHGAPRVELDLLREHPDRRPRDRCELPLHRRVA
jgi:MFS family permease